MTAHAPSILVVLAAAFAAPVIGEFGRRIGLSIVVIELALGVAIGPQRLGWAAADDGVAVTATYGMAFLFFLAGLEIDLLAMRGAAVRLALGAWFACVALALAVAYVSRALGLIDAWIVVGAALATTLSLIVAMTQIAVAADTMRPEEASPLVIAGVLSVLVFPATALALAGTGGTRGAAFDDRDSL